MRSKTIINYQVQMQTIAKLLILSTLVTLLTAQIPILVSDPYKTKVTNPQNGYASLQMHYTNYRPNFVGFGAQWMWAERKGKPTAIFMSNCPDAPTTLYITADDTFSVYLNGVSIATGNWPSKWTFTIKPQCGINNFTVIANNIIGQYGLIYAIVQNQDNCYKCGALAFYNPANCKCQCQVGCKCERQLQEWIDYPVCGCACINKAFTFCNPTQFFNDASCRCDCLNLLCSPQQEQDPESCQCRCKSQTCGQGQIWSYWKCACVRKVCALVTSCQLAKTWDSNSCSCQQPCSTNEAFDNNSCSCASLQPQN